MMHAHHSGALLVAFTGAISFLHLATAQSQYPITTSMLFLDTDPQPLVGSIIASSGDTTTYSVKCSPGTDASDCGIARGGIVTLGPSEYDFYLADSSAIALSVHCQVSGTVPTICTISVGGDEANDPGVTTVAPGDGEYDAYTYLPITITAGPAAGAGALASVPATSTTNALVGGIVSTTTLVATSTVSSVVSSSVSVSASSTGVLSSGTSAATTASSQTLSSATKASTASVLTGAADTLVAPTAGFAAAGGILGAMMFLA